MSKAFIREIYYFKSYYLRFFEGLPQDVKTKFNWTLQLIATLRMVPEKYFKHISGSTGLYEIRVEVGSDIYRVFGCFDKGQLVILLNGYLLKKILKLFILILKIINLNMIFYMITLTCRL
jgi:hypothetical protein